MTRPRPMEKFHVSLTNILAVMLLALLPLVAGGQALADPVPDIKINGADEITTIATGATFSATIQLDAAEQAGNPADWWIVAETPMGWYYYEYPHMWHGAGDMAGLLPASRSPF